VVVSRRVNSTVILLSPLTTLEYFSAKSDLNFMRQFREDVSELGEMEASVRGEFGQYAALGGFRSSIPSERQKMLQGFATDRVEGYQDMRERVSKGVIRAIRIGRKLRIPTDVRSVPAPMVGGAVIPQNILMAAITDNSHGGIQPQLILDTMNMIVGACEARVEAEWRKLLNPLNWIKEILTFILRIPFMIIEATGFDVHTIENHLFGRLFKLIEILILIYIALRLGIRGSGLVDLLKGLFTK
jgi:hypothetical protein